MALGNFKQPGYISLIVNSEGDLLSGESVKRAIQDIDRVSGGEVLGIGLNCCPIEGGKRALEKAGDLVERIKLFYPNASNGDPSEYDGYCEVHKADDIEQRADQLFEVTKQYPSIEIVSGCCGHDHNDIEKIVKRFRSKSDSDFRDDRQKSGLLSPV